MSDPSESPSTNSPLPPPFLGVSPLSPRETVSRMNELFHGFSGVTFFTICYGVIDLEKGKVRMVRAGCVLDPPSFRSTGIF
jgi:hypothetical protein